MSSPHKFPVPQFPVNLRRIRERKGLTQAALAERIGVRQKYISDLESAGVNPPLGTAAALAEALETPLKKFLENLPE